MIFKRNRLALAALALAAWCGCGLLVKAATPSNDSKKPATVIRVDGSGQGRIFEGIGGLSAGAASRFLRDYPEPYQTQILDYLFKPNYGASLQHLKVEIGGDTNSTWGSEPSHMHSRDDENYRRGYEWWLMVEARKRNPQIMLDILPWGAPGWVGNHHLYSQDMIDYDLRFINAAHDLYGADINYVGIWNETAYDREWIKALKSAVLSNNAKHGLNTHVIAGDEGDDWQLANDMDADPALLSAVDVLGVHYPRYESTQFAQQLQRGNRYVPLWDSEDSYSVCPDGVCLGKVPPDVVLAKMLNRNYIVGKMTKTVHCTVAAAFPAFLPYREGLVLATAPWSGHYDVSPSLWAIAHTTQFAQPGWQYIDDASGLIKDQNGKIVGSYVSLKSPNNSDYSVILETVDAKEAYPVTLQVAGLSSGVVHVWHSNLKAGTYFMQEADLPGNDAHSVLLEPTSIYSLTTTGGQQKGDARPIPPGTAHPFPFSNDFEADPFDQPAKYFADMEGSFEVTKCLARQGKCLRQMVDQPPIAGWNGTNTRFPLTLLGDQITSRNWTNYQLSVDVLMEEFGSVTLWGRVDHAIPCTEDDLGCLFNQKAPDGYALTVSSEGWWSLGKSFDKGTTVNRLKSGVLTGWPPKAWHKLKVTFSGNTLNAYIDGKPVVENYVDSGKLHSYGMVALGTEWNHTQFDNFCLAAACP